MLEDLFEQVARPIIEQYVTFAGVLDAVGSRRKAMEWVTWAVAAIEQCQDDYMDFLARQRRESWPCSRCPMTALRRFPSSITPNDHGGGRVVLDAQEAPVVFYRDNHGDVHIQGHTHTGNLNAAIHTFDGQGQMYVAGQATMPSPAPHVIVAGG